MAAKIFDFADAQNETESISSVLRRLGMLSQEELDKITEALRQRFLSLNDHGIPEGLHIAKLDFGEHRIWTFIHISEGILHATDTSVYFESPDRCHHDHLWFWNVRGYNTQNIEYFPLKPRQIILAFEKMCAQQPLLEHLFKNETLDLIAKIRVMEYLDKNGASLEDEVMIARAVKHALSIQKKIRDGFGMWRPKEGIAPIREIE